MVFIRPTIQVYNILKPISDAIVRYTSSWARDTDFGQYYTTIWLIKSSGKQKTFQSFLFVLTYEVDVQLRIIFTSGAYDMKGANGA